MTSKRLIDGPEAAAKLLADFYDFYDGVVFGIEVEIQRGALTDRIVRVQVEAQTVDDAWVVVLLTMRGVTAYLFEESRLYTNIVLSLGIGIHFSDDGVLIDLSPSTERPWSSADIDASHQYVKAQTCEAEVLRTL